MLDNVAIAPLTAAEFASSEIATFVVVNDPLHELAFSQEEEERKREEYLLQNTALRMKIVSSAITFAERNMPAHLRRNQPRMPHQKFE